MIYRADITWADLVTIAERNGKAIITVIKVGLEADRDWTNFQDGRSDATIASALGRTTAEVTELNSAFTSMQEIHNFLTNVAATTGNHADNLRDFA